MSAETATQSAAAEIRPKPRWLNRTVLGAGVTSALGDFCYETTNAVLPGFFALLGIPAAALGAVEGIADAVSSFTKIGAGYFADRLGHRKALVVIGYGLTPLGQIAIALAIGWPMILLGRAVGWFGKGIRGPLRDAIVAESITSETRGRAFGFHRAADTIGAVVGPLLGVAFLSWAQSVRLDDPSQAFRLVFWLAIIPGVLSMLSFAFLVKDDESRPNPALRFWASVGCFPAEFRRYLAAVGIFGIGDFSHALLILAATELLTPSMGVLHAAEIAASLYIARNVVQTVASYPIGYAADKIGHRTVLLLGYALGVVVAVLMVLAFALRLESLWLLGGVFLLAGLYVAVQEALEPSLTAGLVPDEVRGIAYGVLGSVNGVGKLASSAAVGFLWTAISPAAGFGLAAALMAAGTVALMRVRAT
jgi:MFS family permease